MAAAGLTGPKRGESEDAFLVRMQAVISKEISQEAWDALSEKAQDWNNDAADAILAKKPLPPFPDAPAPEPAAPAASTRRRGGTPAVAGGVAQQTDAFDPQLGDAVVATTKRGKVVEGVIVAMDEGSVTLNAEGEAGPKENDVDIVRAGTVIVLSNTPAAAAAGPAVKAGPENVGADEGIADPEIGDTVQVVTVRGKTLMGVIEEMDGEGGFALKEATGEIVDLTVKMIASWTMKAKGAPPAPAPAPAATGRRGAAPAPAPAPAEKAARSSNAPGVTVGGRVRELLVNDPSLTVEQVSATMKKEGIEFRDASVKMIHKDTTHVIELMNAGKTAPAASGRRGR